MATKAEILEAISSMTVLELSELIKEMEEKFGVSAAAPVAVAAAAAEEEGAADAKSEFDVILAGFDDSKKISVIKAVREATGLGLKEAKDMVEAGGKAIKEGVSKEEADALKAKLEEAGAKIEIK